MSYNGTDLSPDPLFLQTGSYDARSDRKTTGDEISAGVVGGGDYAVTYSGGTLVLNVAAGTAYVKGGNIADQGTYRQYISAGTTVTCPVADPSNPRIDTIILRAFDNAADGSALNKGRVECVPGTPTVGATLSNLSGANALSSLTDLSLSFIVLAYVLVPAGATVLTSTAVNIRDGRSSATVGRGIALASSVISSAGGSVYRSEFNTVAETDWIGTNGVGITIPVLQNMGQSLSILARGSATVLASSTPTHIFKCYLGGVAQITTPAFSLWASNASPSGMYWDLAVKITCNRPTLPSANPWAYLIEADLTINDVTGQTKPTLRYKFGAGPITYAFGSSGPPTTFRWTHQWGTANNANDFEIYEYQVVSG